MLSVVTIKIGEYYMGKLKIWIAQTRANFLLLSVVLVCIGGSAARFDGYTHYPHFFLVMIGVVLTHISVNLFNEYSDFKTGIDSHTIRTPFSGGSGSLQSGHTSPRAVKIAAFATLFTAFIIGVYFTQVSGPFLWILLGISGISIVFYTSHITRTGFGEFFSGMTLGTFVVLGTYYVLTGELNRSIVLLSIPPGILTLLLLFLNEFPDMEADRAGGRRTLVILLGLKKAAYLYAAGLFLTYAIIFYGIVSGHFPYTLFIAYLTIPLAVKAAITALKHGDNIEILTPALGLNVSVVLGTDFLLALGFLF